MSNEVKIIVQLHEGEKTTKKIWRFDPTITYSKDNVCAQVKELFPHLCKKGLEVELHHYDELAGKVSIESDGDLEEALKNFVEEWKNGAARKDYLTLHAVDCMPRTVSEDAKEVEPPSKPSKKV